MILIYGIINIIIQKNTLGANKIRYLFLPKLPQRFASKRSFFHFYRAGEIARIKILESLEVK